MVRLNTEEYLSLNNLDGEIWKDIKGWEGCYKVSNKGRVKALNRDVLYSNGKVYKYRERIMKAKVNKSGYVTVCLSKNGYYCNKRLHQLVIAAFLDRPKGCGQINHKDENKQNNELSNLEYCTGKYNNNYGTRNKRVAEKQMNDPTRSVSVSQYTTEGELINVFPSIKEAFRKIGADVRRISACCNGFRKTEKGFVWAYSNDGFQGQKKRYRLYLDSLINKKRVKLEQSQPTLF